MTPPSVLRRRSAVLAALATGDLVRGPELMRTHGVCQRTVMRDVEWLRTQGHEIEGERGYGYMLRPPVPLREALLLESLTSELWRRIEASVGFRRGIADLERIVASYPPPTAASGEDAR